ncbi:TMAO reductase system periplasmic protein TorT [uncultured Roseovarius sp.]|uniref:TMAO reductase system periplasmic protein TorT n=1 Tax=uncultured Roseovarius sp. TaxID=293344 RepID=UPI0026021AA2|nr:TMAO reductase system periplasmic protein TorT [uncultured Roseovarius sp.]
MQRIIACFLMFVPLPLWADGWAIEAHVTPFDYSSATRSQTYNPLGKARDNWTICVSYPHLKDAYWLSVNYGMVEEAERLGVGFRLVEAGGYPNLDRQIEQIRDCVAKGADALVVGTVSFDGLTPTVLDLSRTVPVIAAVNDIADPGVSAKAGVSWYEMGAMAGRFIAARHPPGSPAVQLAWFPGPKGAGWVSFVEAGFREAVAQSSARIAITKYGDTGREIQVSLVEETLDSGIEVDYLVGSAPTAEVAVSILRARGLSDQISIVSDYMSHAVFRGIRRGRILAAPTDFPILQGKLAIEMAVRAIEGSLDIRHAGPKIRLVVSETVNEDDLVGTLAPASFIPVFEVE